MAVMIRCCSCFSSPPSSDHIVSPKPHLPAGKLATLLFKARKLTSSSGDASSILSASRHKLPGSESVLKRPASDGHQNTVQAPPVCDFFFEILSAHQGNIQLRSSAMTFLVTNALMWTTPLEALAETCEADSSIFNMPLLLFVALVGATVGGLLARQRKGELQRLNEQLRQINSYAPTLSYAPVGSRILESEVIVDPRKEELISRLKAGKNFLRNQDPEKAFVEFKSALELAQNLKDPIEEKKAARGLGASLQRQGKLQEAIKYHSLVLALSKREGEESGNTEAYGAIADCYTELGDLEQAAKFYDKYIARLETD
ncbi:protein FLUORESCENT IN BLUE LIGHT [Salix suchowensis]|nr:protein FLUORESCENT IN BLUE LIGHT [Salix suchowensis]